ncbi:MAG: replication/maintenance protein RepL [Candidatus Thermoplasmatota archaeon]|nr:replication/maintenance protein RepL [Candidatus Thermoplasmatota archaeon]
MSTFERVETVIDVLTGEIVSERKNVIAFNPMPPEPAYVKLYIEDLGKLLDLQSGHRDILLHVAATVAYDGLVSMTTLRKRRIAAALKCSIRSIDNAITEFVKREILLRLGRAEYELNPHLFAKGSWKEIRERRLQFTTRITYNAESGRTIETTTD